MIRGRYFKKRGLYRKEAKSAKAQSLRENFAPCALAVLKKHYRPRTPSTVLDPKETEMSILPSV